MLKSLHSRSDRPSTCRGISLSQWKRKLKVGAEISGTFLKKGAPLTSTGMIWYLLYPFRGTTEPPALSPAHPLRRAFTQYGRAASRHPVITLLISITVASILIYPFPFLYTNDFANGSSNLPHHVWTAAQPFEGDVHAVPDVVMRSVWVHGSYMNALEPHVLQTALKIQDELLGSTLDFNPSRTMASSEIIETSRCMPTDMRDSFHASHGLSNQSWFFHSPLLYWSCSSNSIADDDDITATVNEGSRMATAVNITLRHSIVFSGKRFENHLLVAADALVITLVHKLDSPVGRQWERQAEALPAKSAGEWHMFPEDGRATSSQLYEFKFQPLSSQDDLFLGVAHGMALLYFLLSLTRLRAVRSRFGLALTVITQIAFSIMSSFTVCAILNVDLSKIPRETYPLVVLTVGLENMFRLVNAVIVSPSGSSTASRIAYALGQTGHIALAGVGQNLFILWLLYKFVSPGVGAFCVFAAVALIFDFLYLLTFFIAVLSVDVRRTELSDFLDRTGQRSQNHVSGNTTDKRSWVDAMLRGRLPVSTRIAGSVVMIGFVLIAQWHFFDNEDPMRTFSRLIQLFWTDHKSQPSIATQHAFGVNQARTPTAWIRLQDHETAREAIQVIKPNAHSYIARVYEPLVFVVNGSDRTPSGPGIRPFLPAVYDFVRHQSIQFFMTVLFIVATISLLMNYLLWDEEDSNEGDDDIHTNDEPLLSIKTLSRGHALDIAMLTASTEGIVVSIGLDRYIRVWDIRHKVKSHVVETHKNGMSPFPVLAIALDDLAHTLAILSKKGHLMLWNIAEQSWGPSTILDIGPRAPLAFFFDTPSTSIIVVGASGILSTVLVSMDGTSFAEELQICKSHLVLARHFTDKVSPSAMSSILRIATLSRRGCIHIASRLASGWESDGIELPVPMDDKNILDVVPLPGLYSFLAVRQQVVDLFSLETRTISHRFGKFDMQPSTIRIFHTIGRPSHSESRGLKSFSIAYTNQTTKACVVHTYTPQKEGQCLKVSPTKDNKDTSSSWNEAAEQVYSVQSPGEWEVLPIGAVVGVRKRQGSVLSPHGSSASSFGLRQRVSPRKRASSHLGDDQDIWEAWMLFKGEVVVTNLDSTESSEVDHHHEQQLLVISSGPMTKVGRRSLAVGLGNTVKFISVGNERFESENDGSEDLALAMAGRRRKPMAAKRND